jgi:hypothetical protein
MAAWGQSGGWTRARAASVHGRSDVCGGQHVGGPRALVGARQESRGASTLSVYMGVWQRGQAGGGAGGIWGGASGGRGWPWNKAS